MNKTEEYINHGLARMDPDKKKLPVGWEWKKLSDLFTIRPQKKQARDKLSDNDEISFVPMECLNAYDRNLTLNQTRALKDVYGGYTYFEDNDVLLAKITPCFENGKVGIARNLKNGIGFGSSEFIVFRPKGKVIPEYLYYYLSQDSFRQEGKAMMAGAVGHKRVSKEFINEYQLPFPESIQEQKRIVAILDEAFAAINKAKANAEKNLANAKELFDSYLNGIFANPGEDWEEKKLGEIGKVSMCKRIFKKQTSKSGDIPFYKIGTFGKEANAYISKEMYNEYRNKYSFPKKGDILLSASGTIGRRVKYDGKPAYFQDSNIVWIDNDEKQVLNDYLYHFYSACEWKSTNGATISRLYNDNLRQIDISFPSSKEKQQLIIYKIDSLITESRQLASIYQQKITALEELKKSILKKAFRGEL
jgi:type I restriction enzyme S subunit